MRKVLTLKESLRRFLKQHRSFFFYNQQLNVEKVDIEYIEILATIPNGVDESEWEKWEGASATALLRLTVITDEIKVTSNYLAENITFEIQSYDAEQDIFIVNSREERIVVTIQ